MLLMIFPLLSFPLLLMKVEDLLNFLQLLCTFLYSNLLANLWVVGAVMV